MKLRETMEQFLEDRKTGTFMFYDSSVITYRRKLDVFLEFLHKECNITDNIYADFLRGMGQDTVIKSIEYYVNEYDIKFKITVENYFTVIKAYFDFISKKHNIENEIFDSTKNFSDLKERVYKKIKELKLNKSEEKSPIVKEVFESLNEYCNEKIDSFCKGDDSFDNERALVEFISAIVTKLIMLTGVKNHVLGKIRLKDYSSSLNKIWINGYGIHLPDKLGLQFKEYIKIRNQIAKDRFDEAPLFINKQGENLNNDYYSMFYVMNSVVGNRKAACVAKFTIMEMIKKGINSSMIQEFTSFGPNTYLHCQELVNEEKSKDDIQSKSRYLDSKIRSLVIFDEL